MRFLISLCGTLSLTVLIQISAYGQANTQANTPIPMGDWRERARELKKKGELGPPVTEMLVSQEQADLGTECSTNGWVGISEKSLPEVSGHNIINAMLPFGSAAVVFGNDKEARKELKSLCKAQKEKHVSRLVVWVPDAKLLSDVGARTLRRTDKNLTCFITERGYLARCFDRYKPVEKRSDERAKKGFQEAEKYEHLYSTIAFETLKETYGVLNEAQGLVNQLLDMIRADFGDYEKIMLASMLKGTVVNRTLLDNLRGKQSAEQAAEKLAVQLEALITMHLDWFSQAAPTCNDKPNAKRFLQETRNYYRDLYDTARWTSKVYTKTYNALNDQPGISAVQAEQSLHHGTAGAPDFRTVVEQAQNTQSRFIGTRARLNTLRELAAPEFAKCANK